MARSTILEYLDNFRRDAREVAYVQRRGYRTQRWTYGDVLTAAYRFARELEFRGVGKGDKVVIWGENCAEWIAVFFGCVLRGAIVVPIDKIATHDFAQRVAQQVDARLCVGSAGNEISSIPALRLETLAMSFPLGPTPQLRRLRSRATISLRSFSLPAPLPSRVAW